MTIEDALKQVLTEGIGTSRVYSHRAPQTQGTVSTDEPPYVVIFRVGASPSHTHSGPAPEIERTYQFSCFGRTQSAALGLADQLRRLLDGYRGRVEDVAITACYWSTDYYTFDPAAALGHQASVDMRIHYREAA